MSVLFLFVQAEDGVRCPLVTGVLRVLFRSDYHVFLLSRIRERFGQTGDNAESVAYGLRSTGGLITGAALIMIAVFAGW